MNRDSFVRYIESSRDCDQNRLDAAIDRGLRRARSIRFDGKKLFMLAAACVFTLVMCVTVNLPPLKMAVDAYYQNWNKLPPGYAEALDGYIQDIQIILGGE